MMSLIIYPLYMADSLLPLIFFSLCLRSSTPPSQWRQRSTASFHRLYFSSRSEREREREREEKRERGREWEWGRERIRHTWSDIRSCSAKLSLQPLINFINQQKVHYQILPSADICGSLIFITALGSCVASFQTLAARLAAMVAPRTVISVKSGRTTTEGGKYSKYTFLIIMIMCELCRKVKLFDCRVIGSWKVIVGSGDMGNFG